jgi:hypothetical protein
VLLFKEEVLRMGEANNKKRGMRINVSSVHTLLGHFFSKGIKSN